MTQTKKTFAFFLSTFLAGALFAGNGKLAKELESLGRDPASNGDVRSKASPADVEVIVQYKVAPADAHHQKVGKLGGRLHS